MEFSKYCKDTGIVSEFIRFDPNLNNHTYFNDLMPITQNRHTVFIDLKQSKEDIWKNILGDPFGFVLIYFFDYIEIWKGLGRESLSILDCFSISFYFILYLL